jgi:hypothetical protein
MRLVPATLAAATLLCCSVPAYSADITFQKSYPVSGNPALTVCNNSGIVHITGVGSGKVQISAVIHKGNWHSMPSSEEMKKIAAAPPVSQSGSTVKVGDAGTCGPTAAKDIDIDYEISVPKTTTVSIKSGGGAIHVESLDGSLRAYTGSGDITVNGIGDQSMLISGNGNLDIGDAHGLLLAKTGNGNLTVHDSNVSGAQIRTGNGSITATNLTGGIRANTGKGDINMAGNPTEAWEMRTGDGAITFHANAGAKFELDAETGNGTIDSGLPAPLGGHVTTGVVRGPVNGGGPDVKMYTGNGNITLQ